MASNFPYITSIRILLAGILSPVLMIEWTPPKNRESDGFKSDVLRDPLCEFMALSCKLMALFYSLMAFSCE